MSDLFEPLAATWPAAQTLRLGRVTLRRSPGGGKRVQAASFAPGDATALGDAGGDALGTEIAAAEAAMRDGGQTPLFMVRPGQAALDATLAQRGYARCDPTRLLSAPLADLADRVPPRLAAFEVWPPLAIMTEIWQEAGIGADRRAVMARVTGPRTALFGRAGDRPAGAGFVAAHGSVAMVHALEVRPALRRQGVAGHLMAQAAIWAEAQGCTTLALAVTEANQPARAFYAGLGFQDVTGYHYRQIDAGMQA